jgi:hypothetical protein
MTKYFAVALVAFAMAASETAYAQDAGRRDFGGPNGPVVQSPARDQAIHDCSVEASKYSMSAWQSTQIDVYGECMTEHNQPQ